MRRSSRPAQVPLEQMGLAKSLPEGGVLAVHLSDSTRESSHVLMEKVFASNGAARMDLPASESYYDLLRPVFSRVEIWRTCTGT